MSLADALKREPTGLLADPEVLEVVGQDAFDAMVQAAREGESLD